MASTKILFESAARAAGAFRSQRLRYTSTAPTAKARGSLRPGQLGQRVDLTPACRRKIRSTHHLEKNTEAFAPRRSLQEKPRLFTGHRPLLRPAPLLDYEGVEVKYTAGQPYVARSCGCSRPVVTVALIAWDP